MNNLAYIATTVFSATHLEPVIICSIINCCAWYMHAELYERVSITRTAISRIYDNPADLRATNPCTHTEAALLIPGPTISQLCFWQPNRPGYRDTSVLVRRLWWCTVLWDWHELLRYQLYVKCLLYTLTPKVFVVFFYVDYFSGGFRRCN